MRHLSSSALIAPFFLLLLVSAPAAATAPQPVREALRAQPAATTVEALAVPDPFAEQVLLFETGTRAQRWQALRQLAAAGPEGIAVAARLASQAGDLAEQATRQLRWSVRDRLTTAIGEGRLDDAQPILEALLAGGDDTARRELAGFLALTGRSSDLAEPLLSAWTHRAGGDLAAARRAGERAALRQDADALLGGVYLAQRDWRALARLVSTRSGARASTHDARGLKDLGLAVLAWRLAGEHDLAEGAAARLETHARTAPEHAGLVAAVLLLAGEADRAMPLLRAAGEVDVAFDLLVAERLFEQALTLADEALGAEDGVPASLAALELKRARLLAHLSREDAARASLDAHAARLAETEGVHAIGRTVLHERQLGLTDEAFARTAAALAELPDGQRVDRLLGPMFSPYRNEAEVAWGWLRASQPALDTETALRRVAALLGQAADGAPAGELARLLDEAPAIARGLPAVDQARWYRGLVGLAVRHEGAGAALAFELTAEWAKVSGRHDAWRAHGDALAEAGRWEEAARAWQQSWQANRIEPAPLALAARALAELGRDAEAEALRERASLIALGDDSRRYRLAQALAQAGDAEGARAQRELLLRVADPTAWYFGATLRTLATRAACAEAHAVAVARYDEARVQALLGDGRLTPAVAASLARSASSASARDAATGGASLLDLRVGSVALAPWLVDLDRTADAVARLAAEGLEAEADWLAWRVHDRLQEVSVAFPRSAASLNTLAWFAARTRRELGPALSAAERAVELAPEAAGYADTLAEVHFQLGADEKALAWIDRAIELQPEREYYRRQRDRFRAGDATTDPPLGMP